MIGAGELTGEAIRRALEAWENSLAAVVRGYTAFDDASWQHIENTALRLVLDAATLNPTDLPNPDGTSDLALTLLARALGNSTRHADHPTTYLMSLSSLTFAIAGNFPTAGVVARQALDRGDVGTFEKWVISVLADRALRLDREDVPQQMRAYVRAEHRAIHSGSEDSFQSANRLFDNCAAACVTSFGHSDALLLLLWSLVRQRLRELSASRILLESGFVDERYVRALIRTSPLLYPTQAIAIQQHRLLDPHRNALVLLPTSTGKSLLGELAIVASLSDERPLGVYLAPYRALTDQIFRRMRVRLAGIHVDCEARRGGYLTDRPITGDVRTVLVATPEAFDAFLRLRPDLRDRIACCVFDEFHLVEQPGRGLRYEGLVGRLREQDLGSSESRTRIVALSPVVSPSPELVEWLRADDESIVQSGWRPTARRLAIAGPDRFAHYYTPSDHLHPPDDPRRPSWSGAIPFPHPIRFSPHRRYTHELRQHDLAVASNVAEVAIDQQRRFGLPVLILASTKEQTRFIASIVAGQLPEVEAEHRAHSLAADLARRCPYLFTLRACLRHGVAYHNASLPNWVREKLETLMENRELAIVAATTTLAEGVDLPFRVVVMADWRRWLFGQRRPMPTLLFRNIAGRCGRAGSFAEGDTVVVDNPGRDPSPDDYGDRFQEYLRLYVRPQPLQLRSAVADTVETGAESFLVEMDASVESQFIAYIDARHPAEGHEEAAFTASLFAARFDSAARHVDGVTRQFTADMLAEVDYPVLVRASPMELNDFGRSVLTTGLSPRSGIDIAKFLRDYAPPEEPRRGQALRRRHSIQWQPIISALRAAIPDEGMFIAELQSGTFHRIGRRGYPVNGAIFETVLMAWISGLPVEETAFLTIRSRDMKQEAEEWLSATDGSPPDGLEEQVEQVAVFLNGYIAQQWAWVLRGAAAVSEHAGEVEQAELEKLAARMEHGVRHVASVNLLARGCTIDRAKVDRLVGSYLSEHTVGDVGDVELLEWLRANREILDGLQVGYFTGIVIDEEDVNLLIEFLEREVAE